MDEAQPSPIKAGDVIRDTYEVVGPIAAGGMGAIWKARHVRLGREVAVKVLLNSEQTAFRIRERFFREAQIASELDHPNIVKVIDYNFLPDGHPYIVMEFFKGESLRERLQHGPIALGPALEIVRQVGDALAAVHRVGVIHRDLKPDNIFLCPTLVQGRLKDIVKVIDFGIAKSAESDLTQTGYVFGSAGYMSPEQLRGEIEAIDARTDVFALGAIVYEMLALRKAFAGGRDQAAHRTLYEAPAPLAEIAPGLPAHVVRAVEGALEKDLTRRFPDVASFVEALTTPGAAPKPVQPAPAASTRAAPPAPPPIAPVPQGHTVTTATVLDGDRATTATSRLPAKSPAWNRPTALILGVVILVAASAGIARSLRRDATALPTHVQGELRRAETALSEGRMWDAIDIASRTLDEHKSDNAFAIITRSYCLLDDARSASAELQKLSPARRAEVARDCAEAGIELH